jgi:cytochrome c oxidase subunit II
MATNKKYSLASFAWLWFALTVLGVILSVWVPGYLMPRSMSSSMHLTILTMVVFSVAAAPVAAGVYAALAYMLRHNVYRGDSVPPAAAVQTRENSRLTIGWVLTSTVLTVFLLVWGLGALSVENGSAQSNPIVVNVTGQQWVWSFAYAGTHVQSNTLVLPVDREVVFHVTSKDVTHGFWIAQMGVQVDANNGAVTEIHVTPNKLGTFDIRCTQFCGLNHAFMVTTGQVLTTQGFDNWLAAQPQRA